jgi:hypothetical protein
MLMISKSQNGEGKLANFISVIERELRRKSMASREELSQEEKYFQNNLFSMSKMVKVLYDDYIE